jgi:hypothetical protein
MPSGNPDFDDDIWTTKERIVRERKIKEKEK